MQTRRVTEYVMDIVNTEGIPFRVVFLPDGGRFYNAPVVEFYDRRYSETDHGQFTGARYYAETLFQSADRHEDYGLNLHGGVPEWSIDKGSMVQIFDWLEELSVRLDY